MGGFADGMTARDRHREASKELVTRPIRSLLDWAEEDRRAFNERRGRGSPEPDEPTEKPKFRYQSPDKERPTREESQRLADHRAPHSYRDEHYPDADAQAIDVEKETGHSLYGGADVSGRTIGKTRGGDIFRSISGRDGQPITRYDTQQGFVEFQGTPAPGGGFSGHQTDAQAQQAYMQQHGISDPRDIPRDAYGNMRSPEALMLEERDRDRQMQRRLDAADPNTAAQQAVLREDAQAGRGLEAAAAERASRPDPLAAAQAQAELALTQAEVVRSQAEIDQLNVQTIAAVDEMERAGYTELANNIKQSWATILDKVTDPKQQAAYMAISTNVFTALEGVNQGQFFIPSEDGDGMQPVNKQAMIEELGPVAGEIAFDTVFKNYLDYLLEKMTIDLDIGR